MATTTTVPWKPHAKQRPRVAGGHAYTPKATRDAEAKILAAFIEATDFDEGRPDGPIAVTVNLGVDSFDITVAENADHETPWALRGDVDNYAKTILDALNGHAWVDDKQIVHLSISKESK